MSSYFEKIIKHIEQNKCWAYFGESAQVKVKTPTEGAVNDCFELSINNRHNVFVAPTPTYENGRWFFSVEIEGSAKKTEVLYERIGVLNFIHECNPEDDYTPVVLQGIGDALELALDHVFACYQKRVPLAYAYSGDGFSAYTVVSRFDGTRYGYKCFTDRVLLRFTPGDMAVIVESVNTVQGIVNDSIKVRKDTTFKSLKDSNVIKLLDGEISLDGELLLYEALAREIVEVRIS